MLRPSPTEGAAPQAARNGAPVQRQKRHAQKVIADRSLGIVATYEAIYNYVNNEKLGEADKSYIDNARALLAA